MDRLPSECDLTLAAQLIPRIPSMHPHLVANDGCHFPDELWVQPKQVRQESAPVRAVHKCWMEGSPQHELLHVIYGRIIKVKEP